MTEKSQLSNNKLQINSNYQISNNKQMEKWNNGRMEEWKKGRMEERSGYPASGNLCEKICCL